MACGKPVVVTDMGGLPETADGGGLVVPPRNPEQLAQAIERVLSDPSLSAKLSSEGLKRSSSYSWDLLVGQYEELFQGASRRGP
jgi:glycosyltransferase involved in cell wall biosynthesis